MSPGGVGGDEMIFILLVVPVGFSFWFLVFVLFKDLLRHQFVSGVRARQISRARPVDDDAALASQGWTTLDDQQLARFLKGSAP